MYIKMILPYACVTGLVLLVCCAKLPVDEINKVKAGFATAQQAEAQTYAKELYAAANAVYDSAVAELNKQYKTMPLLRSYERAVEFLKETATALSIAGNRAVENKNRLTVEADTLIKQATIVIEEMDNLFDEAEKAGKMIDSIQIKYHATKSLLDLAATARVNGDMISAKNNAESIIRLSAAAKNEVANLPVLKAKGARKDNGRKK